MNPITNTEQVRLQKEGMKNFKEFRTTGNHIQRYSMKESTQQRYSLGEGTPRYTRYQNFLYQRALYGLKVYTEEELIVMNKQKRKRIQSVHQRAQQVINLWKQTKLITFGKVIFSMFPNSKLAKDILATYNEPDPTFVCTISFKDLGITKEDIITKFLETGLLPRNFHALSDEELTKTL